LRRGRPRRVGQASQSVAAPSPTPPPAETRHPAPLCCIAGPRSGGAVRGGRSSSRTINRCPAGVAGGQVPPGGSDAAKGRAAPGPTFEAEPTQPEAILLQPLRVTAGRKGRLIWPDIRAACSTGCGPVPGGSGRSATAGRRVAPVRPGSSADVTDGDARVEGGGCAEVSAPAGREGCAQGRSFRADDLSPRHCRGSDRSRRTVAPTGAPAGSFVSAPLQKRPASSPASPAQAAALP